MKDRLKRILFGLLGKDPEAVVVLAGRGAHAELMRELAPAARFIEVEGAPGEETGQWWMRLRRAASGRRVALCAASMNEPRALAGALAAFPNRVLAFNGHLERHHVRMRAPLASALFLSGLPKDRIYIRPRWLFPFKKDRSWLPRHWRHAGGRGFRPGAPRVAVLSPYFPWPLAHGGAVRIYHLLKECAKEWDIVLFAFEDGQRQEDFDKIAGICPAVYVAAKPRYREPRWATLLPPEACEFFTPELAADLRAILARSAVALLQTEYTQMARYGGQVLVEHDVTWDLFEQVHRRGASPASWWDLWRWRRFERRALRRFPAIVVMSAKDAALAGQPGKTFVIPNGVDLKRFRPAPASGEGLLFVGSFRHFPNVRAYRFLVEEVWPEVAGRAGRLTVVAGPHPELYWPAPPSDERIILHGFVADVERLYEQACLVVIPTTVSAGTNLKALEAMASAKAIVSTSSGVAGLGLEHGRSVWIADTAGEFAAGIRRLLGDAELRARMGRQARRHAELHYGWEALAGLQSKLWRTQSGI